MKYVLTAVSVFVLDFVLKEHMDAVCGLDEEKRLANGRLILKKYYNTGAAGNLLSHTPRLAQCIHAAVLGLIAAESVRRLPRAGGGNVPLKLGLSLMLGGGGSNLYDRIRRGHVLDYVSFGFGPKRFRRLVFNVSDFCVFAGAVLAGTGYYRLMCGQKSDS